MHRDRTRNDKYASSSRGLWDAAMNIVFVVTCVCLVGALVVNYSKGPRVRAREDVLPRGSRAAFDKVIANDNSIACILVSSDCPYCTDSASFYKRLMTAIGERRVVFLTLEPEAVARRYLTRNGIVRARVVPVSGAGGLPGTPSLVVLSAGGYVKASWAGRLDSAQEREVYRQLR